MAAESTIGVVEGIDPDVETGVEPDIEMNQGESHDS